MILVQDDYLDELTFSLLQDYCKESEFEIYTAGEKEFLTLPTPDRVLNSLHIEGHSAILSFIRKAYKGFDTDARVHADSIINGQKPVLASVLYINDKEGVTPNGTAFYSHTRYGCKLPESVSNEEFDRMITEDSNDESKWVETDRIAAKPNRLLVYDAQYFHAKWPSMIEKGERIILVTFYNKID